MKDNTLDELFSSGVDVGDGLKIKWVGKLTTPFFFPCECISSLLTGGWCESRQRLARNVISEGKRGKFDGA